MEQRSDRDHDVMIDMCGRGERQEGDGTISLTLQHGMTVRAERVVSALPSNALAHCLRHHPTLEKVPSLPLQQQTS
jgi:hypothetical protein